MGISWSSNSPSSSDGSVVTSASELGVGSAAELVDELVIGGA